MKILLIAFLTLCFVDNIQAQSHNSNIPNSGCKYANNGKNYEREGFVVCNACRNDEEKKRIAKQAEDKRQYELDKAKTKALREANQKAFDEKQKRNQEEAKGRQSGEIVINGSSDNSKTQTTSGTTTKPLDNYDPNTGFYTNPMTNNNSGSTALDSYNKGAQQGQQIADIATGIVDLFTPSPEKLKRLAAETAEYERQKNEEIDIKRAEKHRTFEKKYLPLMDSAIKGDEQLRMLLYFASDDLWAWKYVPQRYEWLTQAFKNNNVFAILEVTNINGKEGKEITPLYQHAARLGSVDAMIQLGRWYNMKSFTYNGYTAKSGENAEYAIKAFTEAAEMGSPNAMYYLGMIYKYGITADLSKGYKKLMKEMFVTYSIEPDEKKAFEWFTKSLQPDYKYSIYARASNLKFGSCFESESYLELAKIYKQGKIVPKDKSKAKEYELLYEEYHKSENVIKRIDF